MGVRFITGRAGSGKTHHCQREVCAELQPSLTDGPKLIVLVPEQAALQMERGLLGMLQPLNILALGRCEVLSFRRLAGRILSETAGPSPTPLTALGRQMALRLLMSRHRKSLREFERVADRSTFIAEISRGIGELLQEAVTIDQLDAAAKAADDAGDPTAARLHDAALIYRAYLDFLSDERVDPEGVLDLARSRLAGADWLRGARVYMDGFAGLTRQQLRMIVSLAQIASHVDIALLLDPAAALAKPDDAEDTQLFARTQQTYAAIVHALLEHGIAIEPPLKLTPNPLPRFARAPDLARLEKQVFTAPPMVKVPDEQSSDMNTENSSRALRIVRCRDRRSEVSFAVRTIVDLTQREQTPLRYREIAIIVRDLAPYHDILSAELRAHGVPFFIDRRRPTHHHALIELARGLVALNGGGRFDETMIRILKTGLCGLDDDRIDAIENHVLAFNLCSPAQWSRAWLQIESVRRHPDDENEVQRSASRRPLEIDADRSGLIAALEPLWPGERGKFGHPACSTWIRRMYEVLKRLRVTEALNDWRLAAIAQGDLDEAAEHEHAWSQLVSLLEELDAGLGDEPMTGRQFREVVEAGLSEFSLGLTPPTLDQVLVGSIERSRHPPVRAAIVLGMCEGGFPARLRDDTIFGDAERAFLSANHAPLGRTRVDLLLDERALAYIAVTRPSEQLLICYPESDTAGRPLEPSPFVNDILGAMPSVRIESADHDGIEQISRASELCGRMNLALNEWCLNRKSDAETAAWLALYEWLRMSADSGVKRAARAALRALAPVEDATLTAAAQAALWPPPYRTSVTQLEAMAACPYRHFARYGLNLTERVEHEVSPLHLGNLYHEVLEQFVNELIETGVSLKDLSDDEIQSRLSALCQSALPYYVEQLGLSDAQRERIEWRAKRELPFALRGHRATIGLTKLAPNLTEKSFGRGRKDDLPALELTVGEATVLVRGKIDRVDFVRESTARLAVVFDYKRAYGRRLLLDAAFHGLAMQLVAYLLVLRDAGEKSKDVYIVPGGAFFLPLLSGHTRVLHPTKADEEEFDPFRDIRPRGIIDFDWINEIDPAMAKGASAAFMAKRKKDGTISNVNASDAVPGGVLPALIEHVRTKMTELASDWINGDIRVLPYRHGNAMPCGNCPYRPVCRFEYGVQPIRSLELMSREAVIQKLTGTAGKDDKNDRPPEDEYV